MPTKLDYLQDKHLTPADSLRRTLSLLEDRSPQLKTLQAEEVLALLADLDAVYFGFETLEQTGLDLQPEKARWRAISGAVQRQAATLLQRVDGPVGLRQARPAPQPAQARWWWYIDDLVAERQRRDRRRFAALAGLGLLLLLGVVVLFQTVLKPDPLVLARIEQADAALAAFEAGEYHEALEAIEKGLAIAPDDSDFLIFKGIVLEQLDRAPEAESIFAEVETTLGPLEFYLNRSQNYLQLDHSEAGLQDALSAVAVNPESAEGWFLIGLTSQNLGDRATALEAYQRAAELAQAQGNDPLFAQARINLATLANSGPP